MSKSCLVISCENRGTIPGISYHSLGKKRSASWLQAIGRSLEENLSPHNVICSKHFQAGDLKQVNGRTTLKSNAVPKLFLPKNATLITRQIGEFQSKKPRYISSQSSDTVCEEDKQLLKVTKKFEGKGLKETLKSNKRLVEQLHNYASSPRNMKKQIKDQKQKIQSLNYKCHKKNKKKMVLRKKVNHLQEIVTHIQKKNILSSAACSVLKKTFAGIHLANMRRMLNSFKIGTISPQKHDDVIRSFACTLHFYSRKAYEYVRRTFNLALPPQQIIRTWYSNAECEPGFSQLSFDSIKAKVSENAKKGHSTICSLMLDGLSIKKQIGFYDGKPWGYINYGTNLPDDDSLEYTDEVLVLMVVSLNGNWKLPIAYFFIKFLTVEEKANIVKETLIRLNEIDVTITSLTTTGPFINFKLMDSLGARINVENMKPYFPHPANCSKVYCIFDSGYLMKYIKMNWDCLIQFMDPDGEIVDLNYINILNRIQNDIGNELKTKLELKKSKTKVLETQTLSTTFADSLEYMMVDVKDIRFKEAGPTIKFIRLMSNVFDLLNSKNPMTVKMKMPIQENNETLWLPIFAEALNYLENVKTVCNKKLVTTAQKSPFQGLIVTIFSIMGIYDDYVKLKKIKYLPTHKLSQDHLELFFCNIRSKNNYSNNISALQFFQSYRSSLLHYIENINMVRDETNRLFTTDHKIHVPVQINDVHTLKKYDLDMDDQVIYLYDYKSPVIPRLTNLLEDVVTYVGGYTLELVQKTLKCSSCIEALYEQQKVTKDMLLSMKNKWKIMVLPSKDVITVCHEVEVHLRRVLSYNKFPRDDKFVHTFIMCVYSKLLLQTNLFKSIEKHNIENLTLEENHVSRLIKSIAISYFKIRTYNLTKIRNQFHNYFSKEDSTQKKLNKLILSSYQ